MSPYKEQWLQETQCFEEILEEKPTFDELCEHIRTGSKLYQLGVQLKLNVKKLEDIHKLPDNSTYKTAKIFELWLDTEPDATRRQVIDALRKEVMIVAREYEQILWKSCSLSQSQINLVKVSQLLFSERCISEETLDRIETLKGILDEKKTTLLSAIYTF